MTTTPSDQQAIPFWRDERVINVLSQVFVFGIVIFVLVALYRNMTAELEALNLPLSMDFLSKGSGFDIAQSFIEYSRTSNYLQAFYVGVLNTLIVAAVGIVFATLLGIVVGIARLSTNWLVNRIAVVYIEIFRNIPLLVFLIFWYQGVFLKFPSVQEALEFGGIVFSNRGVSIPWGTPTEMFSLFSTFLIIGLVAGIIVYVVLYMQGKRTGRMPLVTVWGLSAFLALALIGWFAAGSPLEMSYPALPETGFNILGGKTLSSEFMALVSGLVLYTAAFIGEVVRAGIQSVSKGQTEASRALGLSGFQTLRLIVFPQAMRVIIPPLTSQFLNLTKNSSLATAIGYPDLLQVYSTIINQSGRAVEMTAIMMSTYLTISLLTSLFMNWYNKRIRLVER